MSLDIDNERSEEDVVQQLLVRLFEFHNTLNITEPCKLDWWKAGMRCPACDRAGNWRMGYEFEHEMRCGYCSIVWEPEKQYFRMITEANA